MHLCNSEDRCVKEIPFTEVTRRDGLPKLGPVFHQSGFEARPVWNRERRLCDTMIQNIVSIWVHLVLSVRATQEFIKESKDVTVNTGETVLLPCIVRNKVGECRWEKDGTPLGMYEEKYEMAGSIESGDCTLRIRDASEEYDTGVWQCQVTASDFTQKDTLISSGAFLSIRTQPDSVSLQVNDITMESTSVVNGKAGQIIKLRCEAQGGNPTPRLIWSINSVNTSTDSRVMIRSEGGIKTTSSTLSLPVNKDDNLSEIKCIVIHEALQAKLESKLTLNVLYPPEVKTDIANQNILSEGESVMLTCEVDSNPPASITWTKLGLRNTFISSERKLNLPVLSRNDAGTYECQAENSMGLSNPSSQKLDVQCK